MDVGIRSGKRVEVGIFDLRGWRGVWRWVLVDLGGGRYIGSGKMERRVEMGIILLTLGRFVFFIHLVGEELSNGRKDLVSCMWIST